jgi:hypothetical protein
MLNNILQHKITAGIVMAVILAVAWYVLTGTSQPPPILQPDSVDPADQDLVTTLMQLRAVTLDGTIFTDPVFMSLQDFGVEIQPEPVGRPNPFLPLTPIIIQSAQTQQSIHSAQIFAPPTRK